MHLPNFEPVSDDVAARDGALAESRDDLKKLTDHLATKVAEKGLEQSVAELVQGLLLSPHWSRLELASALGAALEKIVGDALAASFDKDAHEGSRALGLPVVSKDGYNHAPECYWCDGRADSDTCPRSVALTKYVEEFRNESA